MLPLLQTGLPPSNLSYLIAAFAVTGVVLLGYVCFIFRRKQETRNEISRLCIEEESGAPDAPSPGAESAGRS